MIKKIKHKLLELRLKRKIKNRVFTNRNSLISTLIFVVNGNYFNNFDTLLKIGRSLYLADKDIYIYVFNKKNKNRFSEAVSQIGIHNFTILGGIKNSEATNFLKTEFDALIGIHSENDIFLKTLVVESKARFKIGLNNSDEEIYDFILKLKIDEPEILMRELKKYLKALNKIKQ